MRRTQSSSEMEIFEVHSADFQRAATASSICKERARSGEEHCLVGGVGRVIDPYSRHPQQPLRAMKIAPAIQPRVV